MASIKGIKKCGKNKYQIDFHDRESIKLYDNVLLKYNLLFKKEVAESLLAEMLEESHKDDAYYQTLNFISKKIRCEKQVVDFLDNLQVDRKQKQEIIDKLKQNRLINDSLYTKAYVQDRMLLSSDGPNKIRKDLLENHIDKEVVDDALAEIEDEQVLAKLEKIISKKKKSNSTRSNYAFQQKTMYDMKNLGYDDSLISQVLSTLAVEQDNHIVSKEYHKLYQKLKNRYEGATLNYQIYCKLRQKGFSDQEIKSVQE